MGRKEREKMKREQRPDGKKKEAVWGRKIGLEQRLLLNE